MGPQLYENTFVKPLKMLTCFGFYNATEGGMGHHHLLQRLHKLLLQFIEFTFAFFKFTLAFIYPYEVTS